ncbi:MAG: apolipoprotein N-acyltransferase [Candidatus Brocadiia bacterium]
MDQTENKITTPLNEEAVISRAPHYSLAHYIYKTGWFRLLLGALSGLLLVISYPPLSFGIIGWVALVPIFVAIFSSPSWKIAGLSALITGVVFYSVSLSFFIEAFGLFGWVVLNLFSIYLFIFAIFMWFLASRIGLGKAFFFIPIFWTGIEYFRSEGYYLRFGWLSLGYSQAPYNVLIQACDIFGVYGLTFLIVTVNAVIAWFVFERIRRRIWLWGLWGIVAVIFVWLITYGNYKNTYLPKYLDKDLSMRIPVAVVQDMFGSVDNYIRMTNDAVGGKQESIVVWPERADMNLVSAPKKRSLIEALVRDKKIYLITGTIEEADDQARFSNLAVMFSPQGEVIGRYAKQVPVQLVETMVKPGTKSGIFDSPIAKVGVLICYEAAFTNLELRLARKDVDFIVMPTAEMGGWGGLSHRHHASIIPFRAIETRRPILRSAAIGISMIVNSSGKVEAQIDHLATGVIKGEIKKGQGKTIFVQYGYFLPRLCLAIFAIYLAGAILVLLYRAVNNRLVN